MHKTFQLYELKYYEIFEHLYVLHNTYASLNTSIFSNIYHFIVKSLIILSSSTIGIIVIQHKYPKETKPGPFFKHKSKIYV